MTIFGRNNMLKLIHGILKNEDCPHCGTEIEYQCGECEKEEEHLLSLDRAYEDDWAKAVKRSGMEI